MAIKFNDYFEFPREFDMAPYTAASLSEIDRSNTAPREESKSTNDEESVNFSKINENIEDSDKEEKKDKEKEQVNRTVEDKVPSRPGDEPGPDVSSKYRLRGVVVHSGQASGGHYYSFIYLRLVRRVALMGGWIRWQKGWEKGGGENWRQIMERQEENGGEKVGW